MRTTSDLYKTILLDSNHVKETKVNVAGVEYLENEGLIHVSTSGSLYEFGPASIGGAASGEIDLVIIPGKNTIPRQAKIEVFVRLVLGDQASDWIPRGVFHIDTRDEDKVTGALTIHGFDAMLKAEQPYLPEGDVGEWPRTMQIVAEEIASLMGVEIDQRTALNAGYMVDYPNELTMREVLRYIAAAHAGNWIMSADGRLLLVPLAGIPAETYYLVTEDGDSITFGGVRILV